MDFIILPEKLNPGGLAAKINGWQSIRKAEYIIHFNPARYKTINFENATLILLGDYWNEPSDDPKTKFTGNIAELIKTIKGNYYCIIIEKESIQVFSCFLNLMPVYYSPSAFLASSSMDLIISCGIKLTVCERNIVETLLFNYTFFDSTIFCEVELLPTHHVLTFRADRLQHHEFFSTATFFTDKPKRGKKIYNKLVRDFIRTVDEYMPGEGSMITFTGGFDGRTIVSSALNLGKKFDTMAFGKIINDDVKIPANNALELGLNFHHIDAMDTIYLSRHYQLNSTEMANNSPGFNGFLYPHFIYLAKEAARHSTCLITGCGGSELFRAAHNAGAVVSQALYDVLTLDDEEDLKQALMRNPNLKILQTEVIGRNIDGLMNDLRVYRENLLEFGTTNRKLYYFMHNETLRKLFGTWIYNQAKYIRVRSPYLDFDFIKSVYESNLAGAYNAFFTHNPIKRFKGQYLYALIIAKTNPVIYRQMTGKGYPPKHILTLSGKLKLLYPFLKRRLIRRVSREDLDNLGILSGFTHYLANNNPSMDISIFNTDVIKNLIKLETGNISERDRDILLQYFSFEYILNL
jgi:asparagine synthetase B (glutamine-hydrolysing)